MHAILVGATGLVGRQLLAELLADPRVERVTVFVRRRSEVEDEKLEEHRIDFDRPEAWRARVVGDVLFSALGTTRKAAGSKARQYAVDHGYQLEFAQAARRNAVGCYVLISSAGASPESPLFYPRMKGELERDTAALGFARARFLRPGPLDGDRREHRPAEAWSLRILRPMAKVLPATARPIHASVVARAAVAAAFDPTPGVTRWSAPQLFDAGGRAADRT